MEQTYFRKGFGLKKELRPLIDAEYQSALVERIRSRGYTDTFGDVAWSSSSPDWRGAGTARRVAGL